MLARIRVVISNCKQKKSCIIRYTTNRNLHAYPLLHHCILRPHKMSAYYVPTKYRKHVYGNDDDRHSRMMEIAICMETAICTEIAICMIHFWIILNPSIPWRNTCTRFFFCMYTYIWLGSNCHHLVHHCIHGPVESIFNDRNFPDDKNRNLHDHKCYDGNGDYLGHLWVLGNTCMRMCVGTNTYMWLGPETLFLRVCHFDHPGFLCVCDVTHLWGGYD